MKEIIQQMSTTELGLNVTVTGIVIVFGMLLLLVAILVLFGKTIQAIQGAADSRKEKARKVTLDELTEDKSVTAINNNPVSALSLDDEVTDEIVAVISAAISTMYAGTNKKPIIKSIKNSSIRRSAWAAAGISENTRAF